ncbi:MAG: Amuc_1100 family pilus-like protein [Verrucomicrobiota bacterium]|nr:Amuc_1100 family pilus-like protein [Verrucomicrobiota bacterium]
MSWFRRNRFLGTLLVGFAVATLAAAIFVWFARSGFDEAHGRFSETAMELNRLQRLSPFPSELNLQKMKTQAQEYAADVERVKADLKGRVLPAAPMAPNEFQARLRQGVTALTEKARAAKVKLPENFFAGFEEFAAALPDTAAAPLLGQELAQTELLLNFVIDAHVDSITSLRRVPPAERTATPPLKPAASADAKKTATATPALIERNVVDLAFTASPSAARRVLNQIASADQQFFIVRTLHILNDKDKGPARDVPATPGAPATATPSPASNSALNFIVGNEHIQTAVRVEMLRFTF